MRKRFLVIPGPHISPRRLIFELYRVPPEQCIVVRPREYLSLFYREITGIIPKLIVLAPRFHGDYQEHLRRELLTVITNVIKEEAYRRLTQELAEKYKICYDAED